MYRVKASEKLANFDRAACVMVVRDMKIVSAISFAENKTLVLMDVLEKLFR